MHTLVPLPEAQPTDQREGGPFFGVLGKTGHRDPFPATPSGPSGLAWGAPGSLAHGWWNGALFGAAATAKKDGTPGKGAGEVRRVALRFPVQRGM